jgi:hypothetical protein
MTSWLFDPVGLTVSGPTFSAVGTQASKQASYTFDGQYLINCGWFSISVSSTLWLSRWDADTGLLVNAYNLRTDPLFDNAGYTDLLDGGTTATVSYNPDTDNVYVLAAPRRPQIGSPDPNSGWRWRMYVMNAGCTAIAATVNIEDAVQGQEAGRLVNPSWDTVSSCGPYMYTLLGSGTSSIVLVTSYATGSRQSSVKVYSPYISGSGGYYPLADIANTVDREFCRLWFSSSADNSGNMSFISLTPPD